MNTAHGVCQTVYACALMKNFTYIQYIHFKDARNKYLEHVHLEIKMRCSKQI